MIVKRAAELNLLLANIRRLVVTDVAAESNKYDKLHGLNIHSPAL